jgi:hypothetical protein
MTKLSGEQSVTREVNVLFTRPGDQPRPVVVELGPTTITFRLKGTRVAHTIPILDSFEHAIEKSRA